MGFQQHNTYKKPRGCLIAAAKTSGHLIIAALITAPYLDLSTAQAQNTEPTTKAYCTQDTQGRYTLPPRLKVGTSQSRLQTLQAHLNSLHLQIQSTLQKTIEGSRPFGTSAVGSKLAGTSAYGSRPYGTNTAATNSANSQPTGTSAAGSKPTDTHATHTATQHAATKIKLQKYHENLQHLAQNLVSWQVGSLDFSLLLQNYFELVANYEFLALVHQNITKNTAFQHSIFELRLQFKSAQFAKLFPNSALLPPNAEAQKTPAGYILQLARHQSYLNLQHALAKHTHWPVEKRYLESIKCRLQLLALQHQARNLLFSEKPLANLWAPTTAHHATAQNTNTQNTTTQSTNLNNTNTNAKLVGAPALNDNAAKICHQLTRSDWAQIMGLQASNQQQKKLGLIQLLPHLESQNIDQDLQQLLNPQNTTNNAPPHEANNQNQQSDSPLSSETLQHLLSVWYPQINFKFQMALVQEEWEVGLFFSQLDDQIPNLSPHVMALKQFMNTQLAQAYQTQPEFKLGHKLVNLPDVKDQILKLSQGCGYDLNGLDPPEALDLLAQLADLLFMATLQVKAIASPLELNTAQDLQQFLIHTRTQSLSDALALLMSESLSYQQNFTLAEALIHFNTATVEVLKNYVTQTVQSSNFASQLFDSLKKQVAKKTNKNAKTSNRKPAQNTVPIYVEQLHQTALEIRNIEDLAQDELPFDFQTMVATLHPEHTGLQTLYAKNLNTLIYTLQPLNSHHEYWRNHFKPYVDKQSQQAEASCRIESGTSNMYNWFTGLFSDTAQQTRAANEQCVKVYRIVTALQLHQQQAPNTLQPVLDELEPYYSTSELEKLVQQYRQNYVLRYYQEYPLLKQYTKKPSHTWAFKTPPPNLYDTLKNKSSVDDEAVEMADQALAHSLQSAQDLFQHALHAQQIKDLDNYIIHTRIVENILGQPVLESLIGPNLQHSWALTTPDNKKRYNLYFQKLVEPELLHYHAREKEKKINLLHATAQARDEFKMTILWTSLGFTFVPWVMSKMRFWPQLAGLGGAIRQRNKWMTDAYSPLVTSLFALNLVDQQFRIESYSKKRSLINKSFSLSSLNSENLQQIYLSGGAGLVDDANDTATSGAPTSGVTTSGVTTSGVTNDVTNSMALVNTLPVLNIYDHYQQTTEFSNRIGNFTLNLFSGEGGARGDQLLDTIILAFPMFSLSKRTYRHLREARRNKGGSKANSRSERARQSLPPSQTSSATQKMDPLAKAKLEKKLSRQIDRFKIEGRRNFINLQVDPSGPWAFNLSQLQRQKTTLLQQYAGRPLKQDRVRDSYSHIVLFVARKVNEAPNAVRPALSKKLFGSHSVDQMQRFITEAEALVRRGF